MLSKNWTSFEILYNDSSSYKDKYNEMPLYDAACKGHLEVVRFLSKKQKRDPQAKN